jgi:hypothetical protein
LAKLHVLAHEPQFDTSLERLTSQPFVTLPSQLAKPVSHAIWHAPLAQLRVPLLPEQTLPHAPQFETSASVGVSQPLASTPSQSP